MGSYKEDRDRFDQDQAQRERVLAEAETWDKFLALLRDKGIDFDEFVGGLEKADAALKRCGVSSEFRRNLVIKAFHLGLGLPQDKSD